VRTGLVAVGAAIAIVGAGVVLAVALPSGASRDDRTGLVDIDRLLPGDSLSSLVNGTASSQATVSFNWSATSSADVQWWVASFACSTPRTWCVQGEEPLHDWSGNTSGEWSIIGSAAEVYCIWVADASDQNLTFTGELKEVASAPEGLLPMLPLAWTVAGGTLLIGMGGVAAYLGLFLPSTVYAPSAEDGAWDGAVAEDPWEPVEPPARSRPPR
jgi:hypothetical protein